MTKDLVKGREYLLPCEVNGSNWDAISGSRIYFVEITKRGKQMNFDVDESQIRVRDGQTYVIVDLLGLKRKSKCFGLCGRNFALVGLTHEAQREKSYDSQCTRMMVQPSELRDFPERL